MNIEVNEPRMTKRMKDAFRQYHVQLRPGSTVVTHRVTGVETSCSPVIFGLFELVLKTQFVAAELCGNPEIRQMYCTDVRFLAMANDIEVVSAAEVRNPQNANRVYGWAVRQIMDSGLYFQLLD